MLYCHGWPIWVQSCLSDFIAKCFLKHDRVWLDIEAAATMTGYTRMKMFLFFLSWWKKWALSTSHRTVGQVRTSTTYWHCRFVHIWQVCPLNSTFSPRFWRIQSKWGPEIGTYQDGWKSNKETLKGGRIPEWLFSFHYLFVFKTNFSWVHSTWWKLWTSWSLWGCDLWPCKLDRPWPSCRCTSL